MLDIFEKQKQTKANSHVEQSRWLRSYQFVYTYVYKHLYENVLTFLYIETKNNISQLKWSKRKKNKQTNRSKNQRKKTTIKKENETKQRTSSDFNKNQPKEGLAGTKIMSK